MQVSTAVEGQNGQMVVKRLSVPIGLEELMEGLTKEVISKKPQDIPSFASNHFAKLLELRDKDSGRGIKMRKAAFIVKPLKSSKEDRKHTKRAIGVPLKLTRQISTREESPTKKEYLVNSKTKIRRDVNMNEPKPKMQKSKTVENFDKNLKIEGKRPKRAASTESLNNKKTKEPKMKSPQKILPRNSKSVEEKKQPNHSTENEKIIPKNPSVEEDKNYIKDGRLTVSPPRILRKTPSVTDKSELEPTSLVVPAIGVATKIIEKSYKEDSHEENHDEPKENRQFEEDEQKHKNGEGSAENSTKHNEDAEKQENSDTMKSLEEIDTTSISEDNEKQINNDTIEDTSISTKTEGSANLSSLDQSSVSYDPDKLRQELVEAETESRLSSFTTSYNPYSLRNEIRNASKSNQELQPQEDTKKMSNKEKIFKFVNEVTAAIKIQSVWRGFKVRSFSKHPKEKKEENTEDANPLEREIRAVVKIQSLWRGFKARKLLKEKTSSMFGATVAPPKLDLENLVCDSKLSRSASEEDAGKPKLEPIEENKCDDEKSAEEENKLMESKLATLNGKAEVDVCEPKENEENMDRALNVESNKPTTPELATKKHDLSDQSEEKGDKSILEDEDIQGLSTAPEKDIEEAQESEETNRSKREIGEDTKIDEDKENVNGNEFEANKESEVYGNTQQIRDERERSGEEDQSNRINNEGNSTNTDKSIARTPNKESEDTQNLPTQPGKDIAEIEEVTKVNEDKENINGTIEKSEADEEKKISKDAKVYGEAQQIGEEQERSNKGNPTNETKADTDKIIAKSSSKEDFKEKVLLKTTLDDDENGNKTDDVKVDTNENVVDKKDNNAQENSETKEIFEEDREESHFVTPAQDKNEENSPQNEETIVTKNVGNSLENADIKEGSEKEIFSDKSEEQTKSDDKNKTDKATDKETTKNVTDSLMSALSKKSSENEEMYAQNSAIGEEKDNFEENVKNEENKNINDSVENPSIETIEEKAQIDNEIEEPTKQENKKSKSDEATQEGTTKIVIDSPMSELPKKTTENEKTNVQNVKNEDCGDVQIKRFDETVVSEHINDSLENPSIETSEEKAQIDNKTEERTKQEDKKSKSDEATQEETTKTVIDLAMSEPSKKTTEIEETNVQNEDSGDAQNKRINETVVSENINEFLENPSIETSKEKSQVNNEIEENTKQEDKKSKPEEVMEEKITKTEMVSDMNAPPNLKTSENGGSYAQNVTKNNLEQKENEAIGTTEETVEKNTENGDSRDEIDEISKDTHLDQKHGDKHIEEETREESSGAENEDAQETTQMLNKNEQKEPCRSIESKIIQHDETEQKAKIEDNGKENNERNKIDVTVDSSQKDDNLNAKNEDSSTDQVQIKQESDRQNEEGNNNEAERGIVTEKTNDDIVQITEVAENEAKDSKEHSVKENTIVFEEKEEKDEHNSNESSEIDANSKSQAAQEKDETVLNKKDVKSSEDSHKTKEQNPSLMPEETTLEETSHGNQRQESKENSVKENAKNIEEKKEKDEQSSKESSKMEETQDLLIVKEDTNDEKEESNKHNKESNEEKDERKEEENVKIDDQISDEIDVKESSLLTPVDESTKNERKSETKNEETQEKDNTGSTHATAVSGENSKTESSQEKGESTLNKEGVETSKNEDTTDSQETKEKEDTTSDETSNQTDVGMNNSEQKISNGSEPEESKKEDDKTDHDDNKVQEQNVGVHEPMLEDQGNKTKEVKEDDIKINMEDTNSNTESELKETANILNEDTKSTKIKKETGESDNNASRDGDKEGDLSQGVYSSDVPMKKLSDEEIANALIHLDKIPPPPGSPIIIRANEDIDDGIPRTLTRSMTVNEPECIKENVSHLNKSVSLDKPGGFVEERHVGENPNFHGDNKTSDSDVVYETAPTRPVTSNMLAPNKEDSEDTHRKSNDRMDNIQENTDANSQNASLEHSGEFHDSPLKEKELLTKVIDDDNRNIAYDSSKLHKEIEDVGKEVFGSVESHQDGNKQKIAEDIAATIIQSTFRGHRVRKELGKIGKKLSKIDEENIDKMRGTQGKPLVLQNSGEFHDSLPVEFTEKTLKNNEESVLQDNSKKTTEEEDSSDSLQHSSEHHDHVVTMSSVQESEEKEEQEEEMEMGAEEVQGKNEAVQCNQDQAGDATMTSPTSNAPAASAGVASTVTASAQAPDKDASTSDDGGRPPNSDSTRADFGMEAEKRNNASYVKKNMEAEAATKIQASFRGYQVRKQLKVKSAGGDLKGSRRLIRRKSSGRITESGRMSQSKNKASDIEEKSATKIQAGVRGFLVRRRQQKNNKKEGNES